MHGHEGGSSLGHPHNARVKAGCHHAAIGLQRRCHVAVGIDGEGWGVNLIGLRNSVGFFVKLLMA